MRRKDWPSASNPSYTPFNFSVRTYIVCQLEVLLARQLIVHSFNQIQDLQERKGRRYLHCCIVIPQIKKYSICKENTVNNLCFCSIVIETVLSCFPQTFLISHNDSSENKYIFKPFGKSQF